MKTLKKFAIVFFSCIGFLVVVGLVCSLTMNKTYNDMTFSYRAETHAESVSGKTLYAGERIKVETEDKDKLSATVTALSLENDVIFTIDGNVYTWNEKVAGTDVSEAFAVSVNQTDRTITVQATLEEMLKAYAENVAGIGAEIVYGILPVGDMFKLTVSVGEQSLDMDFSALSPATDLTLDTDGISFEP